MKTANGLLGTKAALALPMGAALICFFVPIFSGSAFAKKQSTKKSWICRQEALHRSRCLIEAALEDLSATYSQVGGGGITEIKSLATNTFRISISQEERVDQVTYEFQVAPDGRANISKRTQGSN